jgi:tetratricopeptide (TPR) repeat protein
VAKAPLESTTQDQKAPAGDQTVEYFEFAPSAALPVSSPLATNWASEFQRVQDPAAVSDAFPGTFEAAFQNIQLSHPPEWAKEFVTAAASARNADWIREYAVTAAAKEEETSAAWVQEFHQQQQDPKDSAATQSGQDAELRDTALEILRNLETDPDPKLANSRFVAYLWQLAGGHPSQTASLTESASPSMPWRESFLSQISTLTTEPQDQDWLHTMQKAWEQYEPTGFGYAGFAQRQFSTYHYSTLPIANPYHGQPVELTAAMLDGTRDTRTRILLLESLLAQDGGSARHWRLLGEAQQANEMDPQAIAALLKSTRLNPDDPPAWLALAASCANESCIPEAVEALATYASLVIGGRPITDSSPHALLASLESLLSTEQMLIPAASILNSIVGNHGRAVDLLRSLGDATINDAWAIKNRLGASLANTKQYDQAIQIYDQLLAAGHAHPRVHYNRGISLLCQEHYLEAARSFVHSLDAQQPLDSAAIAAAGVDAELVASYRAPWEALGVTFSLAGVEELANCGPAQMDQIRAYLHSSRASLSSDRSPGSEQ